MCTNIYLRNNVLFSLLVVDTRHTFLVGCAALICTLSYVDLPSNTVQCMCTLYVQIERMKASSKRELHREHSSTAATVQRVAERAFLNSSKKESALNFWRNGSDNLR